MSFVYNYARWKKRRKPRKCQKCGKEYLPNGLTQRYCNDCSTKYRPKSLCDVCGRRSHKLEEYEGKNLCSFCYSARRKMEYTLKRQKQRPSSYTCSKCGQPITLRERSAYAGKCGPCYFAVEKVEKHVEPEPESLIDILRQFKILKCSKCGRTEQVSGDSHLKWCSFCHKQANERNYQKRKLERLKVEKHE